MSNDSGENTPPIARAEEGARELSRCEDLADAVGEGIIQLGLDGRVLAATDRAVRIAGRPREELLGEGVSSAFDGADGERVAAAVERLRSGAADGPVTLSAAGRGVHGDAPVEVRLGLREVDGEARDVVAVVREDPGRRRGGEFDRYESVVDTVGEGIYQLDLEGRFVAVNDVVVERTGYSRDELLGEHVSLLLDDDEVARFEAAIADLLAGEESGPPALETEIRDADGGANPCEIRLNLHEVDGEVRGTVGIARDVSGRRAKARELAESERGRREQEQQFRTLVDSVDEYAIFRLDPDGTVASWNEGARRIKGYEDDEIVGEHFSMFYTEEDREAGTPERNLAVAAEEGRVEDEGWRVRADGSRFWANVVITALYGDGGELEGYAKVTRDMTERHEYEERLRRERDLVDQLVETSPVGIGMFTSGGEMIRANDRAEEVLGFYRERPVSEWPVYDEEGNRIPFSEWPLSRAIETGEPVTNWECQLERPDGERRWLSVNAAPMRDEVNEVERVIVAVEDITALKAREAELRRERDLNEQIMRTVPVPVLISSAEGETMMANQRAQELLGLSERDIVDDPDDAEEWAIYDEDGAPLSAEELPTARVAISGEPVLNEELLIERPDGDRIWVSVNAAPVLGGDGTMERIVLAGEDITQLRSQAERLERQRDELQSELNEILSRVSEAFFAVDRDWRFTYVNDYAERLLERDASELIGESLWEEFTAAAETTFQRKYERAMETQETVTFEEYYPPLDTWFEVRAYPSETGLSVYFQDVTRRKERERALKRSEQRYRTLAENFPNGSVVMFDTDLRYTLIEGELAAELGVDGDAWVGEQIRDVHPPEAANAFRDGYRTAIEGESITFETDYGDRTLQVRAVPLRDDDGEVFAGMAISQDVTERRDRERELERYRTIVETVDDGVYALDPDENFVMVNEAFLEMTGYEREDLIGNPGKIVHSDEVNAEAAGMIESILRGESDAAAIEIDLRTADGDHIPVDVRLGPYPYDGDRYGRCGVVRDITDRKEYEQTLRALHDSALELIQTETADEVDGIVVDTVTDVLDLSGVAVYRHDPRRELLVPTAASAEAGFMREEFPAVPPGDGSITGGVYEAGETARYGDVTESPELQADATDMRGGIFVPLGEHGVLIVGSTEPDAFDERTQQLIELVGATVEAAYDRVDRETRLRERERQLATRVRQQRVVSRLGRRALETDDIDGLMDEASRLVADTLGNEYCKVLELDPERRELLLRQGVGWRDGIVGNATVAADEDDSQAAYTLRTEEPVIVEDLSTETRFSGPDLLTSHGVKSGISVIIGSTDDPWGILGTHDTERRAFTDTDANFVQNVANVLASAIERHRHERELDQRREQLEALNDLNGVVQDIIRAVVRQSTREEIEELVCQRLADTESYLFSWIGGIDGARNRITPRAEAGVEDYLDDVEITYDDSETGTGPTGRAIRTKEMQVSQNIPDSLDYEPWRDHAEKYGFQSSAAIPIVYEGSLYGVLNVYSARPDAFGGQEGAVIGQLGEVIGHAIAAIERKEALMSDDVIEIEFEIQNVFDAIGIAGADGGTITLDRTIPAGGDDYLVYGTADEAGLETLRRIIEAVPHWESIKELGGRDAVTRFEVRLSEPPVVTLIAAQGGRVRGAKIEDGDYSMVVHLPHGSDIRRVVDGVQEAYPEAEVIAQRQTTARRDRSRETSTAVLDELTERQLAALEAAFYAGFFEWPRESTGEEVAESLDISAATFHQHLRTGERKILTELFEQAA